MSNRYKTIKVKKRHGGLAEVRSYLFEQAKAQGLGLRFEYYDGNPDTEVEVLEIPHEELDRGFVTARGVVSKFPPYDTFDLISFKWIKKEEPPTNQLDLFD